MHFRSTIAANSIDVDFTCVSQLRQQPGAASGVTLHTKFGLLIQFAGWVTLSLPVAPLVRRAFTGLRVSVVEHSRGSVSGASPGLPLHWLALVGSRRAYFSSVKLVSLPPCVVSPGPPCLVPFPVVPQLPTGAVGARPACGTLSPITVMANLGYRGMAWLHMGEPFHSAVAYRLPMHPRSS